MLRVIYTPQHQLHDPAISIVDGKPFGSEDSPARAENLLHAVQDPPFGPVSAPQDQGIAPLLAVHDAGFVEFLRTAYQRNAKTFGQPSPVSPETFAPHGRRRRPGGFFGLPGYYMYGVGTPIFEHTWQAAYWSAQCAVNAADFVLAGEKSVYALCRPPGHHALGGLSGGLCYLNNAAIAARRMQAGGLEFIAILDIDYHHGNGTQEIFYTDPTVLYVSLHAHPDDDYPFYWGAANETGEGAGMGFNRNFPLPQGTEDSAYLAALDQALSVIGDYAPQGLVVSVGFDTAIGDPIGAFRLTTDGLAEAGRRIAGLQLPTVLIQEGGYLIERLGENASAFLGAFASP